MIFMPISFVTRWMSKTQRINNYKNKKRGISDEKISSNMPLKCLFFGSDPSRRSKTEVCIFLTAMLFDF